MQSLHPDGNEPPPVTPSGRWRRALIDTGKALACAVLASAIGLGITVGLAIVWLQPSPLPEIGEIAVRHPGQGERPSSRAMGPP